MTGKYYPVIGCEDVSIIVMGVFVGFTVFISYVVGGSIGHVSIFQAAYRLWQAYMNSNRLSHISLVLPFIDNLQDLQ